MSLLIGDSENHQTLCASHGGFFESGLIVLALKRYGRSMEEAAEVHLRDVMKESCWRRLDEICKAAAGYPMMSIGTIKVHIQN